MTSEIMILHIRGDCRLEWLRLVAQIAHHTGWDFWYGPANHDNLVMLIFKRAPGSHQIGNEL